MSKYTEGILEDGVCILKYGNMMSIDGIVKELNANNQEEYKDHEFCKAVDCLWSTCSGCSTDATKCVYTAKEFHKWLKLNGYLIVKDGE